MKRYFLTLLFVMVFSLNVSSVFADVCDAEYMANLKEQVNNISIDYNYVGDIRGDGDYQLYEVSFTGMIDDIYIGTAQTEDYVYHDGEKLYVDSGNRQFYIYSTYCADYKLRTISVKLPKFNVYSLYDDCEGLEGELEVCEPWYQGSINFSSFEQELESYYDDALEEEMTIYDFLMRYYQYGIGILIVLVIVVILSIYRSRKNRLD